MITIIHDGNDETAVIIILLRLYMKVKLTAIIVFVIIIVIMAIIMVCDYCSVVIEELISSLHFLEMSTYLAPSYYNTSTN